MATYTLRCSHDWSAINVMESGRIVAVLAECRKCDAIEVYSPSGELLGFARNLDNAMSVVRAYVCGALHWAA